jgi:hypothetical protein
MKELHNEDIFDKIKVADAICITTNCSIYNSINPMGALAGAAAQRWKNIPEIYAKLIYIAGNVPCILGHISKDNPKDFISIFEEIYLDRSKYTLLIAVPTMYKLGEPADLNLVERSMSLLLELTNDYNLSQVYAVRFGCGVGGLDWQTQVYPTANELLDDRFIIMNK